MNAADRRQTERRSALDVYLCLVDLGDNCSAMLLDVSETGIGVQAVQSPAEGSHTSFRFQLPETAVLIEGEGDISWADRAGRMGIRFTRIAPELKPELRKWVASMANPLFATQPVTEQMADLDARDRVAQLEARIIVSGWAQLQALNFLVDQISAMTQAGGVAIAVEDGSGIVCKASTGIAPRAGQRVDSRSGLSWECLRTKEVVHCADTENDPRVDRIICRQLNMRSAMLVPVNKDGRVAGLVEVFSSQPHAFSNQTVILLKRVAEAVASLDETAPDRFGGSEPLPASPAPVAATSTVAVPPPTPVEPNKVASVMPGPVVVKPAPHPTPAAPAIKPTEPVPPQPVLVQKPVAMAPIAPTPKPVIAPAAPSAAETTLGVPFAQEIASVSPAPAPVPVKPVEAPPAPVVVRPEAQPPVVASAPAPQPAVATRDAEVAAPLTKPAENRAPEKSISEKPQPVAPAIVAPKRVEQPKPVQRVEVPVTPSAPKEKPAVAAKTARSVQNVPAPTPVPTPSKAPRPAATSTAAAAAPSPKKQTVRPEPAAKREQLEAEVVVEEVPPFSYAETEAPDRRKLYIGAAAAAFIALSTYGGWYWAHVTPTAASSATVNAASTPATVPPPPAAAGTPAALPTSLVTPTATATAAKVASPVSEKSTTTKPAVTQPADEAPVDRTTTPSIPATSFVRPSQQEVVPVAPVLTLPAPNTAGMASLLAVPVGTPKLGRAAVSQGVTGGKLLLQVQPIYPSNARTMRLNGTVTMVARISKTGTVTKVDVISGHPMLNAAAVAAVRRWKYEPFKLNGDPIENDIHVEVRFDMVR